MCIVLTEYYIYRKGVRKENIIIDNTQDSLKTIIYLPGKEAFVFHMHLHMQVESSSTLRVGSSSGKVEIDLIKCKLQKWQGLGTPLENHLWFGAAKVFLSGFHIAELNVFALRTCTFHTATGQYQESQHSPTIQTK